MSGNSRNPRPPPQDYWIYLPVNRSGLLPPIRSLNPRARTRDPWFLVEEGFIGDHGHGFASFPPHPSVPLLLMEESYRAPLESPPAYYQPWNSSRRSSAEEESKLSPEEQKQAVDKLRKQLYSPHMYNIIRRLGNKSASAHDEEGKRCAVCLEDFETKQFVTSTPCNHMFHEECIVPWVKTQGKCPVCRFVIAERAPPQPTGAAATRRNLMF